MSEDALKLGIVYSSPDVGRNRIPPFTRQHRFVNAFLQLDLCLFFFFAQLRAVEQVALLRQNELRSRGAGRGDQSNRGDPLVLGAGDEPDGAAFTVADHRDPLRVDVLAITQEFDCSPGVFRVVGEPG